MAYVSKALKQLDKLYTLLAIMAAIFLIAMAMTVLLSIFSRVLGFYVSGLTHISGYLMASTNCMALAYTFRKKEHIRITLLSTKLREKSQLVLEKIVLIFSFIITVYVACYMFQLAYSSWVYDELATGSEYLKLWVPQATAAIGFSVLSLSVLQEIVEYFFKIHDGSIK